MPVGRGRAGPPAEFVADTPFDGRPARRVAAELRVTVRRPAAADRRPAAGITSPLDTL